MKPNFANWMNPHLNAFFFIIQIKLHNAFKFFSSSHVHFYWLKHRPLPIRENLGKSCSPNSIKISALFSFRYKQYSYFTKKSSDPWYSMNHKNFEILRHSQNSNFLHSGFHLFLLQIIIWICGILPKVKICYKKYSKHRKLINVIFSSALWSPKPYPNW